MGSDGGTTGIYGRAGRDGAAAMDNQPMVAGRATIACLDATMMFFSQAGSLQRRSQASAPEHHPGTLRWAVVTYVQLATPRRSHIWQKCAVSLTQVDDAAPGDWGSTRARPVCRYGTALLAADGSLRARPRSSQPCRGQRHLVGRSGAHAHAHATLCTRGMRNVCRQRPLDNRARDGSKRAGIGPVA